MGSGGVAAVGGVAEGVDVEAVEARGEARDPPPHLGIPGGGVLDEVEGAGDSAVGATAADEGDALEAAGFPCHSFLPFVASVQSGSFSRVLVSFCLVFAAS